MIKAGAYGIFRVVGMIFTPAHMTEELAHQVIASNSFGYAIIWIGISTMFIGAFMALLSTGAKKILAYSSVSQMGYILLGVGVAAYLGYEGAMGFAGALYHIINHAFFKAGLFMMVGSVYMITHDLDITRVRGMFRKLPIVGVTFLIAFAGIGGVPGFNGYASKTILHHAIVEAYEHKHLFSLLIAEKIFVLTSAMTLCYFTKLFYGLFFGKVPEKLEKKDYTLSPVVYGVLGTFGLVILGIGLFPHFLLNKVVIPAMNGFTYDHHVVDHLHELNLWNWHDIEGIVVTFAIAAMLYTLMTRFRFFRWQPPRWLSVETLFYIPLTNFFLRTCCNFGTKFDSAINLAYLKTGKVSTGMCRYVGAFDATINDAYEKSGGVARRLAERTEQFDGSLNEAYERSGGVARRLAERTEQFDGSLNEAYEKSGGVARRLAERTEQFDTALDEAYKKSGQMAKNLADKTAEFDGSLDDLYEQSGQRSRSLWDRLRGHPSDWNIKNLNFDSLLIALMLGLFLFVLIYYTKIR
jgi:NADH:ubiquinone oxidoreductase subunit 5 (subunit L)/multisubunit Na+/H+ antiporter MnhA subunit